MLGSRWLSMRRLRPSLATATTLDQRATFFSFLSPTRSLTKSHKESKVVPFTCDEMFDVVADVDRYREFLPFCVESRVLRRPNDNVMEAALKVGFKLFTESYTSRVLMIRPNKIVVKAIDSPTFKRIESEWIFKPCSTPGSCEIDFKVTFEVSSILHANAIQLFFDDVALSQLNAFIGRARKLYGSTPRSASNTSEQNATVAKRSGVHTAARTTSLDDSATTSKQTNSISASEVSSTRNIAKSRASRRIKGGISSKTYDNLAEVFQDYADRNGKLYYGGFTAACMALGDEYEDLKDVSDSATLAGAVFSSFETSATPKEWLSMDEFVVGVYLMTKGTFEQKALSLFEVVNSRGDGKITREELTVAMQRRIAAVKKLFPKLLHDQVQIQMENEQVEALSSSQDEALARGVQAIESLMEEVEKEIPLAVNQIFREADLDQDDYIGEEEWLFAWQAHPEFVELLTIDGMKKMAQWASVVNTSDDVNDDDDKQRGPSAQSLDTRLTYVD
ncbi:Coenzyme Q-binding protein coq10, mitochondrial [Phytophthora boehmeriae]|uniref:Coenzyme Q-binding protein coq10, mitochondrial n=1 Tax=Phytophthora boehmeriae TaxID=109152 RepID=A0A8T1X0F9_9STRA|nr:Coenzyme Q-binding protein coq10, mitochondrial [Phytophthora boehmeriae]